MDQRLGGHLPRQLPNAPQPHPQAITNGIVGSFGQQNIPVYVVYVELTPVSRVCPLLKVD